MRFTNIIYDRSSQSLNYVYKRFVDHALENDIELLADYECEELKMYETLIENRHLIQNFDLLTLLRVVYNRGFTNYFVIKREINEGK